MASICYKFIRSVGVALASLIAAQCITTCASQGTRGRAQRQKHPNWDRLQKCWLDLDSLGGPQALLWDRDEAHAEQGRRAVAHRAALDALVEADEIDVAVADQMQIAFEEAAFHIWRSHAPATCYRTVPTKIVTREDLIQQLALLYQVTGDLDPAMVERVQAAIARDLASFKIPTAGEAEEAACILVDLLLEKTE